MPDATVQPLQRPSFSVEGSEEAEGFCIQVRAAGEQRTYVVPTGTQQDFSDFYRKLAADFGTRTPEIFGDELERSAATMQWRPLPKVTSSETRIARPGSIGRSEGSQLNR